MQKINNTDRFVIITAITLLIIGFLTIIIFSVIEPFNDWSCIPNPELFSQFGSFIGGFIGTIFSLVAAILIYRALVAQKEAISKQEDLFTLGSFENIFFNLLKTQQEITTEIKVIYPYLDRNFNTQQNTVQGRKFFAFAKLELAKIYQSIENGVYLGSWGSEEIPILRYEIQAIEESHDVVRPKEEIQIIHDKANLQFINYKYKITNEVWERLHKSKNANDIYELFFTRYRAYIGHYFRHLFHLIKFSQEHRPPCKNGGNETNFIDFIQAQMSSYELMLLFYNAMSFPKMQSRIIKSGFLENLAEEDLVSISHNCVDGIKLKKSSELIGVRQYSNKI